jgi:uncharacterized protein (DUF1684 family)
MMNTMKNFILGLLGILGVVYAQPIDTSGINYPYPSTIVEYQRNLNKEYADPETSPLDSSDLAKFSSLNFFPITRTYFVQAYFEKRKKQKKLKMKTSTDRKPVYIEYADVKFLFNNVWYKLCVYQNVELSKKAGYEKYLFLPFTDLTTGETTYGGGRYIDLEIPDGKELVIDFNKCYNPYCAYAHRWSCPIPPPENFLNVKIEAGVKEGIIYK